MVCSPLAIYSIIYRSSIDIESTIDISWNGCPNIYNIYDMCHNPTINAKSLGHASNIDCIPDYDRFTVYGCSLGDIMKNYIYLLAISCFTLLGVLVSINMFQTNIMSVIGLFIAILFVIIAFKSNKIKTIAHTMENLEILFMFLVFIGLLYLSYSMYSVNTNLLLIK